MKPSAFSSRWMTKGPRRTQSRIGRVKLGWESRSKGCGFMTNNTAGLRYGLLAALVLAVAVVGFSAFVSYLKLDVAAFAGSGLLFLAVAAGTASFFSPCSFPLLVALLARETGAEEAAEAGPGRALGFAAALAVGVSLFLLLLGGVIAAGAGPLVRQVTFTSTPGRALRVVVGTLLILLGLAQARGVRVEVADRLQRLLQRAQANLRRTSPNLGFGLFGFGYVLAGFG